MSPSFGLDATSALQALRNAVGQFKGDDLNEDLARECAGKAWHLCDHVFKALGANSQFGNLRALQDHVREACPELAYLQDVCTQSKHAEITLYRPHIDEARFHAGDFSSEDFCGEDFDTSRLEIVLCDGRKVSFSAVEFSSDLMRVHGIR